MKSKPSKWVQICWKGLACQTTWRMFGVLVLQGVEGRWCFCPFQFYGFV